jgi:hypothetical protein
MIITAEAEAKSIERKASAENKRAQALGSTPLGSQLALLSQHSDMVTKSIQGIQKVHSYFFLPSYLLLTFFLPSSYLLLTFFTLLLPSYYLYLFFGLLIVLLLLEYHSYFLLLVVLITLFLLDYIPTYQHQS